MEFSRGMCVSSASSCSSFFLFFFFNDTATPEIYPLSLHDALPISSSNAAWTPSGETSTRSLREPRASVVEAANATRSEEHTSELQSRSDLVCRLLLEKKKRKRHKPPERGRSRFTQPAAQLD